MAVDGSKIRDLSLLASPSASAVAYLVEPASGDYKVDKSGMKSWLDLNTASDIGVAYVSATTGNNSTGTVGRPDLPYLTLNAALDASNRVSLLTDVTLSAHYTATARTYHVYIPHGITLTIASGVFMLSPATFLDDLRAFYYGPGNIHLAGLGSILPTTGSIVGRLHIDVNKISLAVERGSSPAPVFRVVTGATMYIKAKVIDASLLTSGMTGLFQSYSSATPSIIIGNGTRIWSGGVTVLSVGGPSTTPKIHLGAGVLIYSPHTTIWFSAFSQGGISSAGAYYSSGAIPDSGVIHGSMTLSTWLTPDHMTTGNV